MKKLNKFLSLTLLTLVLSVSVNVMGQNPFEIEMIQPNNTDIDWIVGHSYTISWTDNLTQPVNIYVENDNFTPALNYKINATGVVGSTWVWDINDSTTAAVGYKIRVESSVSPLAYNDVGATFDIVNSLPGSIELLQPNVADIDWAWNTTHVISWTDNVEEALDVYLVNSALAVDVKLNTTAVVGSTFDWVIANTPGGNPAENSNYKIRVQSSLYPDVDEISDNTFTISKTAGTFKEIYQPDNTSLVWRLNSTHLISWRDELDEPVDIFVQRFDNTGDLYQIGDDVLGSTFEWDLTANTIDPAGAAPWVSGVTYTITLKSSIDETIVMESEYFTLANTSGEISAIYQPLTTASWTIGTTHIISWLDNLDEPVDIFYWNGAAWVQDNTVDVVGSTYEWTIPSLSAGTDVCKIKVQSTVDGSVLLESDLFDLTLTQGTYIDLIQPNIAGISWTLGYDYYISWDDDLLEGENVDLYLCGYNVGGGFGLEDYIDIESIASDIVGSTHVWTVDLTGMDPLATSYRIKIVSHDDATIFGYSTSTFNIILSLGTFITIEQPVASTYWMNQTTQWISWLDNCPENVYIYLDEYYDNGTAWTTPTYTLAGPTDPDVIGSMWEWDINQTITIVTPPHKYKIRVLSSLDATLVGESDFFHIAPFGKAATSIGDIDGGLAANVVVYPNPTSGTFNVSAPGTISKVEVRNLVGQVLFTGVDSTIDVSGYDSGLYIINIEIEGQVVAKKLFVQ